METKPVQIQLPQIDEDIFESLISCDSPDDQNQRYQQAIRNSMMARGEGGEGQQTEGLIFAVGQETKKLTYEEATKNQYGFQGVLLKESPNLFGGWDERYCILKGQRLVYKQDKYAISPNAGILNFNLLSCTIQGHKTANFYDHFIITVNNSDKNFIFKAKTLEETTQWMKKLNQAIKASQGYEKKLSYLAHYPRFWRKDYESESQFRKTAETGDVLLFRGKKSTSMMQRAITRDQFDHVAVVLLNAKREVLLLEANGGFGVGICPWNRFILKKWYQQYDLVVHRHVNVRRDESFVKVVDEFVSKNMGKKYDFSLKEYLFSRNSTGEDDREVFFCSSLVAKLFKKLELLDASKSCTQYLPSWFGNGGGNLRSDGRYGYAYFDDQKIIVFQNIQ